jgi:hypothetical protein
LGVMGSCYYEGAWRGWGSDLDDDLFLH